MKLALFLFLFLALGPRPARAGWKKAKVENCNHLFQLTYGPTKKEFEILANTDEDLLQLPRGMLGQTEELNENVLKALKSEPLGGSAGSSRKLELSKQDLQNLFRDIVTDPKINPAMCAEVSTKKGKGMCWALAIAVHLKTFNVNLHNDSVRKLWAVGPLEVDGHHWKYHATTIVRVKGEGWYALDPLFVQPMPVADWYKKLGEYDVSGTMRLFSTPAKRFGVTSNAKYSKAEFSRDLYQGFFNDLMHSVRQDVKSGRKLHDLVPEEKGLSAEEWAKALGATGLTAAGLYELYELNKEK